MKPFSCFISYPVFNSILLFGFVTNFAICYPSQDDEGVVITNDSILETVDYITSSNRSISQEVYQEKISFHFKLPLSVLRGKLVKQALLRISQTNKLPGSYVNIDVGNITNEITDCNSHGNETVMFLKLSGKSKCSISDANFKTLSIANNGFVNTKIGAENCSEKICIDVSNIIQRASICKQRLVEELHFDLITCRRNGDNELNRNGQIDNADLLIGYSGPNCDFDERCKWSNQSENIIQRKVDSDCCSIGEPLKGKRIKKKCQECKMLAEAEPDSTFPNKSGSYGVFVPDLNGLTSTLVSPWIYGSEYGCSLQFSIWSEGADIAVTIQSEFIRRTIFVYESNKKSWEQINIPIGKIDEIFQAEIRVDLTTSYYFLAVDNINFVDCQSTKDNAVINNCNKNEYQCSTGLCISRDMLCDLVPDCFYGEDENKVECDAIPEVGKCGFESSICNWTVDRSKDRDCKWKRQAIVDLNALKRSAENKTEGHIIYISGRGCSPSSLLNSPRFPAFNSTSGSCKVRFSYVLESESSLYLNICYNTTCQKIWTYTTLEKDNQWHRQVVTIPNAYKSYFLQFEADVVTYDGAIDNIAMTADCFYRASALIDPKVNPLNENDMEAMMTSIGASVGIFLGVIIAITILLVYKRYGRKLLNKDPYRKVSAHSSSTSCSLIEERHNLKETAWVEHFDGSDGSYRPSSLTYSDIATTISPYYEWSGTDSETIRNVPRKKIKSMRLLGKGAFGEVYYGLLADVAHIKGELPVAIKTLPSLCSEQTKSEFFFEALILSKFRHPNIVKFLGISVDDKSMFLILELMEGGDVRSFLRDSRPRELEYPSVLSIQDLLQLATDIALGCQYLELNKFIHRDIAARNCLLTERGPKRIAKIADFGMARDVFRTNYYRKNGIAMIPVKWMPPEAFMDGVFTVKTDVWAFGVVLWEIFTMGFVPYPGRTNAEVMTFVTDGGRLDKPPICPEPISELINKCWNTKPNDRPSFMFIVDTLKKLHQCNQFHAKINLSDLKHKGTTSEENTISYSSTINFDTLDKSSLSQKTVTADVHVVSS